MTELLLVGLALSLTALAASLWAWRKSEAQVSKIRLDLVAARLVATAATHTGTVLADRIRSRDAKIAEMVSYIDEHVGSAGLVDLLNDSVLPDGEGGDDPSGMPN